MCHKCSGLLIRERSYDCHAEGRRWLDIDRCINCGWHTDPIFEQNRAMSRHPEFHVLEHDKRPVLYRKGVTV